VDRLAERFFSELRQLEHPWCLGQGLFALAIFSPRP